MAHRRATLTGGGTGTVGYLAPEQAFGRPSPRSDVFSAGLILYRLFAGCLPEWPYAWPGPGFDTLRRRIASPLISVIRRAIEVDDRKRYADGGRLLAAFRKARRHALRPSAKRRAKPASQRTWQSARVTHFLRRFGKTLEARYHCAKCLHPVSETMHWCPWCGTARPKHRDTTRFPARCRRCGRGIKRDWPFCAWCYGGRVGEPGPRRYPDARYEGRCAAPACPRRELLPFSRYCPWCRAKVRRPWKLEGGEKCPRCRWGVAAEYWQTCPWCGVHLADSRRRRARGG